ncbi:hypothetical protein [Rubritalea sp.]|uniref:hypothetical protein n=1 Tax=Rubritalea sp. TaxID=2109375 RepID=UPI003EF0F876
MKTFLLSLALSLPLLAESPPIQKIMVEMEVPSPAWKLRIESVHKKDGKLLVVTRAEKSEGVFTQQVSKTKAEAELPNKLADIPRETYVLDAAWNTNKEIQSVTQEELDAILAGSTKVYQAKIEITADDFIGLTLAEAEAMAKTNKLNYRIVEVDGQPCPVTMDFRMDRFNYHVQDGKVIKVTKG